MFEDHGVPRSYAKGKVAIWRTRGLHEAFAKAGGAALHEPLRPSNRRSCKLETPYLCTGFGLNNGFCLIIRDVTSSVQVHTSAIEPSGRHPIGLCPLLHRNSSGFLPGLQYCHIMHGRTSVTIIEYMHTVVPVKAANLCMLQAFPGTSDHHRSETKGQPRCQAAPRPIVTGFCKNEGF